MCPSINKIAASYPGNGQGWASPQAALQQQQQKPQQQEAQCNRKLATVCDLIILYVVVMQAW